MSTENLVVPRKTSVLWKKSFRWSLVLDILPVILVAFWITRLHLGKHPAPNQAKEHFHHIYNSVMKEIAEDKFTLESAWENFYVYLNGSYQIPPCLEDISLLTVHPVRQRLVIAAALFNCEDRMPNFILQILKFLSLYGEDEIRISIYESGSTDLTPDWLSLFQSILNATNVQNRIIVSGVLTRSLGIPRINFLAKVRNEVVAPLEEWNGASKPWKGAKVIFINDVYFCVQHILRLLLHQEEDIVCGMDFGYCFGCVPRLFQQQKMIEDMTTRFYIPTMLSSHLSKVKRFLRWWRRLLTEDDYVRLGAPLVFYDRWVTVDVDGSNFENSPPYVLESSSADVLRQGYPIYVYSCWNGMAVLNSEPLYKGLKFRPYFPEECEGSECFFLSHDYNQLGYNRILVDSGVRLAYKYNHISFLYNSSKVPDLEFRSWDIKGIHNHHHNHQNKQKPLPNIISCCVLSNGKTVDFDKDCRKFDYTGLNCTLRAMGVADSCSVNSTH